ADALALVEHRDHHGDRGLVVVDGLVPAMALPPPQQDPGDEPVDEDDRAEEVERQLEELGHAAGSSHLVGAPCCDAATKFLRTLFLKTGNVKTQATFEAEKLRRPDRGNDRKLLRFAFGFKL